MSSTKNRLIPTTYIRGGIFAGILIALAIPPLMPTSCDAQSFGSFNRENIIDQAKTLQAQFEAAAEAEIRRRMIAEVERSIQNARRGTQADLAAAARRRTVDNMVQRNRITRGVTEANVTAQSENESAEVTPSSAPPESELPFGFTQTDIIVFDDVFGRFNPLRVESVLRLANETDQANMPTLNAVTAWNQQVQNAARHRLAEISAMRDEAIQSADINQLKRATRMEIALSTYALAALQKPTSPPSMNAPAYR